MNGVGRVVAEHGRQDVLLAPDDRRRPQGQMTSYPDVVGAGMYVEALTNIAGDVRWRSGRRGLPGTR